MGVPCKGALWGPLDANVEPSRSEMIGDGTSRYPARLVLRDGQRTLTIVVDEVVWVEAAGNYVQIYTARKTHLVRHTVKAMELKLDPQRFVRVRPSAIVSIGAVMALNARAGGDYMVVLDDGTEIRTSRGFRDRVEDSLADTPGTARHALANRRRRRARAAARKASQTAVSAPTPPVAASSMSMTTGHIALAAS